MAVLTFGCVSVCVICSVDAKVELRGKLETVVTRWNIMTMAGALNAWKARVELRFKLDKVMGIWNNQSMAGAMNAWKSRCAQWAIERTLTAKALGFFRNIGVASAFNTWADVAVMGRVVVQGIHLGKYVPQEAITSIRTALGRTEAQERLIEWVCSLIGCDRASIFLVDVNTNELVIHGTSGAGIRIPINAGIAGNTATTGEYFLSNDPYNDPQFNPAVDQATGYVTTSILSVPIFNEADVVVGVLQCINKNIPEGFDGIHTAHQDTRMAKEFAMLAGVTLTYSVSLQKVKSEDFVQVVPDDKPVHTLREAELLTEMQNMAAHVEAERAKAAATLQAELEAHQAELEAQKAVLAEARAQAGQAENEQSRQEEFDGRLAEKEAELEQKRQEEMASLEAETAALQAELETARGIVEAEEMFTIACPDGAVPGQILYVMSPLGKQIEVTVPPDTQAGDLIYIGGPVSGAAAAEAAAAEAAVEETRLEALQTRADDFWRGSCHRRPFNKWLRVARTRVHKRQWRFARKFWFRWHDLVLTILEQRKQLSPPPQWSTPLSGDNGAAPSAASDSLSGAQSVLRNALTSFMPEDNAPHSHPGAAAGGGAAGMSPTQQWVSNMRPLTLESLNELPIAVTVMPQLLPLPPTPAAARLTRETLTTRVFSSQRLRLIQKQRVALARSYRSLKAPEPLANSLEGADKDAATITIDTWRTAFNGWLKLTLASKLGRLGKLAAFVRYAEWLLGRCFRKWRRNHLGWREAKLKGQVRRVGNGNNGSSPTRPPVRKVARTLESVRWSADRAKAKAKAQNIGGQIKTALTPDRRQSAPMMTAAAAAAAASVRGTPEDRWLDRMRREMKHATESPAKVHLLGAQP